MSNSMNQSRIMNKSHIGKQAPFVYDPKKLERPGLTSDEIVEIKEAFDTFDTNNQGSLDLEEFCTAMKSLGFDKKNPALYKMIEELDMQGSNRVIHSDSLRNVPRHARFADFYHFHQTRYRESFQIIR